MFKSTSDIVSLSCEAENEVKNLVQGATLILVLNEEGDLTPIAVKTGEESETKFIDRKTAEEIAKKSTFTRLPDCFKVVYGTSSQWCMVDGGAGFLVYNYKP